MPLFTTPLALIGLLALPVLTAIYLLRNRYRRQTVSSLLLWLDPREARTGGPRIDRLQTPLLFFLELLLLLLVVLAAAGPHIPLAQGGRPLVVILDDSFSMRAGEPDSPRAAALKDLEEELKRKGRTPIRFVLAGEKPTVLGEPARTHAEAMRALEGWQCRASGAALPEAVALAGEVGGERAALLVVTDQKPEQPVEEKGRLQWRAFGSSRGNLAFVTAARTHRDGADRCLLEITNLSADVRSTTLLIETTEPAATLKRERLTLKEGESHRVILQLPEKTGALRARLDDDDLPIDNEAILLPTPTRLVPVQVSLADRVLREQTEKALRATRAVRLVDSNPAVLITDSPADPAGETWVLRLSTGMEQQAFDGPFVIDKAHPLAEGLSLQGVVWAPGSKEDLPDRAVVLAGNAPLVTDSEDASGRHLVRLRLRHDLSSLLESPSWPVLLANLLAWRASAMSGLSRSNIRLGEEVSLTLERPSDEVRLIGPNGSSRRLNVQEGRVAARGDEIGTYEIRQGDDRWSFAVNAVNRDESDLRECESGRWGDWLDETALKLEYQEVGWVLLILALGAAALHLLLVARYQAKTARSQAAGSTS